MSHPVSAARRRLLFDAVAGAAALGLSPLAAAASAPGRVKKLSGTDIALPTGDVHDFDFFVGRWTFSNRRLKRRWVGSGAARKGKNDSGENEDDDQRAKVFWHGLREYVHGWRLASRMSNCAGYGNVLAP